MTHTPPEQSDLDARVMFHLDYLKTHGKPHSAFFGDVALVSEDEITSIESAHSRLQLAIAALRLCKNDSDFMPINELIYQVFDRVEQFILHLEPSVGSA